jgi:hypothetical protein
MDTLKDIKKSVTDEFMSRDDVRSLYGFTAGTNFDDYFAVASIENILFYIISYIIYIREKAHELWQSDVEATALETRYGTKQWWHKMALAWQKGDSITVHDDGQLEYETTDTTKQINKYCAVIAEGRSVYIRVAKANGDDLVALSDDEVLEFQSYIDEVKPLGIRAIGQSYEASKISISATIYYDPQQDKSIIESNIKTAINSYLKSIVFGGVDV